MGVSDAPGDGSHAAGRRGEVDILDPPGIEITFSPLRRAISRLGSVFRAYSKLRKELKKTAA